MSDDYFRKRDAEKLAKLKAQHEAHAKIQEMENRKALHYFKCGKCGADMKTEIFKGVEIEKCTECGSVLLDPGELEQLAGADESGMLKSISRFFSDK